MMSSLASQCIHRLSHLRMIRNCSSYHFILNVWLTWWKERNLWPVWKSNITAPVWKLFHLASWRGRVWLILIYWMKKRDSAWWNLCQHSCIVSIPIARIKWPVPTSKVSTPWFLRKTAKGKSVQAVVALLFWVVEELSNWSTTQPLPQHWLLQARPWPTGSLSIPCCSSVPSRFITKSWSEKKQTVGVRDEKCSGGCRWLWYL